MKQRRSVREGRGMPTGGETERLAVVRGGAAAAAGSERVPERPALEESLLLRLPGGADRP